MVNNGETSAKKVAEMFALTHEIDMEIFEMLESLEAIQDTVEKLTELWPESLESYNG